MATHNKNNSTAKQAENMNPETGEVSKAVVMSEEEKTNWSAKRTGLLKAYYAELLTATPETLQALARQRVARLLDERCNTAASKVALLADSSGLSTLEKLLESKRLDAASKATVQENFAELLMSGTLKGSSKARALEVFKGGKVAEMQAFLSETAKSSSK